MKRSWAAVGRGALRVKRLLLLLWVLLAVGALDVAAAVQTMPVAQAFRQEVAEHRGMATGLPEPAVQLVESDAAGRVRVFVRGAWYVREGERWVAIPGLAAAAETEFPLLDGGGQPTRVRLPWKEVRQVLRQGDRVWVATAGDPYAVQGGEARSLGWPSRMTVNQIAADPEGNLVIASSGGLYRQGREGWLPVGAYDDLGRGWGVRDVLGVAFDRGGRLWFAVKAGVGSFEAGKWTFHDVHSGLPWNEFTGIVAGEDGLVWFGTQRGLVGYDGRDWRYRQGPRWLPHDEIRQVAVGGPGEVWVATPAGPGLIRQRPMTLHAKAAYYEDQLARYIKRTEFGFVAEAPLLRRGELESAQPNDSDNDGLWTAMYGAGQCFLVGATGDAGGLGRARQAFEALRFLQKVTQGGSNAPPPGYIARTIRPVAWPDPNVGRLEQDRREREGDRLWKVYEPRWPRSADGKWFWKSDTSSDELDGHYFFYPLYYEFCAGTEAERERVREVVRGITDHLLAHEFMLTDHDGKPTRWGVYGPSALNRSPDWWQERGLNSLSVLSYLAVARFVTGDGKYEEAARELVERHGYGQNLMFPKVQQGPGSGNQSDDEMAFMCFYTLLRYGRDEALKNQVRLAFYRYWLGEAPEMNPFFNFAYAAHNRGAQATTVWGTLALDPLEGWLDDAMSALRGFSLDRLNWPHRNSHRLDVRPLGRLRARDVFDARRETRGHRLDGRVLPVENRHFNHWNTDPWALDYGGDGNELASGTVFLLPYYMGLYHGFITKP